MAHALRRPYRQSGGRGAWAAGSAMLAIARLVRLVATIVVLIIVAAIILRLAGANPGNTIVHDVHSVAATLVGPFKNVFTISNPKTSLAVNWGLAAIVYLLVGHLVARLIARMAPRA